MNIEFVENTGNDLSFLRNNLLNEEEMKLVNPSASFPFNEEYWREFFANGKTISYYYKVNEQIVGHAVLKEKLNDKTVWLCWVLLKHQYRGKGLAEGLLQAIEKRLVEDFNKKKYYLNVRKYNTRAIKFYNKNGFSTISQAEGNFQMVKLLNL